VKTELLTVILLAVVSLARASDKAPPVLEPEEFRFLRTEQETFPPIRQDGKIIAPSNTVIYGIFAFRYSHPTPFEFWGFGKPGGGKFTTRFTDYRIRKSASWERLFVGYCGTGAKSYVLQPGVVYKLRISLSLEGLSDSKQIRVSADSPDATFWSEPFTYPR
jgi:hypothetical protein